MGCLPIPITVCRTSWAVSRYLSQCVVLHGLSPHTYHSVSYIMGCLPIPITVCRTSWAVSPYLSQCVVLHGLSPHTYHSVSYFMGCLPIPITVCRTSWLVTSWAVSTLRFVVRSGSSLGGISSTNAALCNSQVSQSWCSQPGYESYAVVSDHGQVNSFYVHCSSSLSCTNDYHATHSGGYVCILRTNSLRLSLAEQFHKSGRCSTEQSARECNTLCVPRTGYCGIQELTFYLCMVYCVLCVITITLRNMSPVVGHYGVFCAMW